MFVAGTAQELDQTVPSGSYPTLAGLLPPKFNVNDPILASYIRRNCKLCVSIMLHDGKSLWLVESAKQPKDEHVLGFPQETIEFGRDGTIRSAIVRGLGEELGLSQRSLRLHGDELFRFENRIPVVRTGGVARIKMLLFFAVRIPSNCRFTPNPAEVRRVAEVTADSFLDRACGGRPDKCTAQIEALLAAAAANVLDSSTWSTFTNMYGRKQPAH